MIGIASVVVSCAEMPRKEFNAFQLSGREYLYDKSVWSFSGRVAVMNESDSFTASINWKHLENQDVIEFAGPFGQGRTILAISDNKIVVDYGENKQQFFGVVDELVVKHLGIDLPVSALKYWVLGLVKPKLEYKVLEKGFIQSNWMVSFQQMKVIDDIAVPYKVRAQKDNTKLKLVISHWEI